MLIRFSVENFRSFRERQTLYLSAVPTCKEWQSENVAEECGQKILRSAVVYGANASGKTNLFLAIFQMRMFMLASVDVDKSVHSLAVAPFLLSTESTRAPETFEIQFSCGGKIWTYGFSLLVRNGSVFDYEVVREWLIENVKKREVVYFLRERREATDGTTSANVISVNAKVMPQGIGLESRTRPDALFFTVAAQFAEPTCLAISEYLRASLNVVSGVNHSFLNQYTTKQLATNMAMSDKIRQLVRDADTGICDLRVAPDGSLQSLHEMYDKGGSPTGKVTFGFSASESQGTQKIFDLSGSVIDTLENGRILVVDEFDAKLHPVLVRRLLMLFNDSATNPRNAQLVVNVQSPDLLAYKVYYPPRRRDLARLRRDQVFFVEKDACEASRVTSLVEFKNEDGKSLRNDASFAKGYMMGLYGGIPYVKDLLKTEA